MKNKTKFTLFSIFLATGVLLSACHTTTSSSDKITSSSDSSVVSSHEHTFAATWSYDETSHWHASTCGHDVVDGKANHTFVKEVVNPTFETEGYTINKCSICDYSYIDEKTEKLKHNYSEEWTYDKTYHWHACTDEGYENLLIEKGEHELTETVIVPTEDAKGYTLHACKTCPYSYKDNETDKLPKKYEVKFVVDGNEVLSEKVEEGNTATYTGEIPTKEGDDSAIKYRFKGWDKDLATKITEDTTFTALFAAYAEKQIVDDFESYESSSDMIDAGWKALYYNSTTNKWDEETKASVSLGSKSVEGNKALRFDAWTNGTGYKFRKDLTINEFNKSANAIKFRLQIPSLNSVKVLLHAKATIGGTEQTPYFSYTLNVQSDEYVEYVVSFADDSWALWGEAGKSIKSISSWTGIHEDDLVNYLTAIEFYASGSDNAGGQPYFAFLDSVSFVTLDNPTSSQNEQMGQYGTYTGLLNNGYTLKVQLGAENTATATVLDMETPMSIPGSYSIDANKVMTFTSTDNGTSLIYKGKLVNGGQSVKFVSATGTLKDAVNDMNLNSVQIVDNYDQYTEDGKAYYQNNKDMSQRSGARGAYYSEYYSGGTSDVETFGGNGWVLLGGDGSQLKLKTDGGHSGKNYLCMKNGQYSALRYMQWGLFDGTSEQNNFRGSKLSFWAKTNGLVPKFKVSMYSQTKPRNATKDQYVKSYEFTQSTAISEWTHFEIELDITKTYYGFLVFMEKNNKADSYLYIDDVEVYTANPYATYVAPDTVETLSTGSTYSGKINELLNANLTVIGEDSITLSVPAMNQTVTGTYAIDGDEIEIAFGTTKYIATLNSDRNSLTFKSIEGSDLVAQALNGVSFNQYFVAEDAESYTESGTMYYQSQTDESKISGARGAYYCDYYSGSSGSPLGGSGWSLMGGNGDQLSLDSDTKLSGNHSLKLKYGTAGNMRYLQWGLYKGTNEGKTGLKSFTIYLKNPTSNAVSGKIVVYSIQTVNKSNQGSNRAELSFTIPANTNWMPYTVTLDASKTYYGFGIILNTNKTADYIYADMAYYSPVSSSVDNDPTLNYYAKKDMTLSGTTSVGSASIKFGENGKVYLTCAAASYTDVEGTYTLVNNGTNHIMVITIGENTMTGKYVVNPSTMKSTFTVTSASGAFANLVSSGVAFTN